MYYTPGWGALLTVVGTLSGVALTQWNASRQSGRQRADVRRGEQREAVLDLLEAIATLESKLKRFASVLDKAKATIDAGTFMADPDDYYTQPYREAIEHTNALRRAIRKGELIITDKKIMYVVQQLKLLLGELAPIRTDAGRSAENGCPDSTALHPAINKLRSNGFRLMETTRRQLAR